MIYRTCAAYAAGVLGLVLGLSLRIDMAAAEPFYVGAKKCEECHRPESDVWEGMKHAKSFGEIHRKPEVRAIIQAAGGNTNMRRNEVCIQCHYTNAKADAGAQPQAVSGPSCESCHGPASDWISVHNNFGGPNAKKADETPANRAKRQADASKAGMIWPQEIYEVAQNCMSCHGLSRPGVDGAAIGKMIEAGHPVKGEFEFVLYSQGTVRHRFYNSTTNSETAPAEAARAFIAGHAAALVNVTAAKGKSSDAKFTAAQQKLEQAARKALDAVKGAAPEAATLLSAPTDDNAQKLVAAIASKDLSAQVGGMLPAKNTYK